MMVIDHRNGEVLARVGSADFFGQDRFGAIDMTRAVRSPGSTLKPIVYGLAFEFGLAHPETLIDDKPVSFGTYTPDNFDEEFHGTITIREALARSRNVPAVKVLDAVGPGRLVGRLARTGISTELPAAVAPSLAVALGGIGIRLDDMAKLYGSLARQGRPIRLRHRFTADRWMILRQAEPKVLLDPVATHYVTSILRDAPPPGSAKKGWIAFKTGTSYGYRDAWAAGYDGRHTIVVWVGRPDAASTPGLTGTQWPPRQSCSMPFSTSLNGALRCPVRRKASSTNLAPGCPSRSSASSAVLSRPLEASILIHPCGSPSRRTGPRSPRQVRAKRLCSKPKEARCR